MMRVSSTASAKRSAVLREAGRQHRDHRRREDERDREQHGLHDDQQREDAVGEQLRGIGAGLLADARIGRHEGGVERTLGEDRAEMIGQPHATKKASAIGPAPRMAASTMSRPKPVRRDSSVKPPTVKMRPIMAPRCPLPRRGLAPRLKNREPSIDAAGGLCRGLAAP